MKVLIGNLIIVNYAIAEIKVSAVTATASTEICKVVMTQAYEAIGEQVKFIDLPGVTSIQYADEGKTDAELFRISGVDKKYKNLIQVPIAINYINATVLSTNDAIEIGSWKDLAPYRIGIRRGVLFSTNNTEGMNTFEADTSEQLLKMLEAGRLDVVVLTESNALLNLKTYPYKNVKIIASVQKIPLFHYIHVSKSHLLSSLSEQLYIMKESGEIENARINYLNKFLK
ncbi:substrate-binding periplasmic protein [Marinicellulosiphila megalodicopiae]|uniref:substrate-binding periplasmic protein n=1 Tax=Marinicellulosiphila megalodicopiae TaxID=2724896 RepID=UPI003BB18413